MGTIRVYLVANFARCAADHSHQNGVMAFKTKQDANSSIYDTTHKYNNLHQTLHFPSLVSTDQSDNAHLRLPPQQTAARIPHQTHPTTTFPPSHLPPQPPNPTTHTLSPHPPTILCLHPRNPPPRPPANHAPTIPSTRAATAAAAADPTARRIAACRLSGRLVLCWGRAVWRWVRLGRMG